MELRGSAGTGSCSTLRRKSNTRRPPFSTSDRSNYTFNSDFWSRWMGPVPRGADGWRGSGRRPVARECTPAACALFAVVVDRRAGGLPLPRTSVSSRQSERSKGPAVPGRHQQPLRTERTARGTPHLGGRPQASPVPGGRQRRCDRPRARNERTAGGNLRSAASRQNPGIADWAPGFAFPRWRCKRRSDPMPRPAWAPPRTDLRERGLPGPAPGRACATQGCRGPRSPAPTDATLPGC